MTVDDTSCIGCWSRRPSTATASPNGTTTTALMNQDGPPSIGENGPLQFGHNGPCIWSQRPYIWSPWPLYMATTAPGYLVIHFSMFTVTLTKIIILQGILLQNQGRYHENSYLFISSWIFLITRDIGGESLNVMYS